MMQPDSKRFYSHGKLLLFGEYAVLDGATALAIPTRFGQSLEIAGFGDRDKDTDGLKWQSRDSKGQPWFTTTFDSEELRRGDAANIPTKSASPATDDAIRARLLEILSVALKLSGDKGFETINQKEIITHLEFPREWGLGTSSTLIANLSELFGINPYALSDQTLGGSGYDLACAGAAGPIFYTRREAGAPEITAAPFQPAFADSLYFVFSGNKQDSRAGIKRYREQGRDTASLLQSLTAISKAMATTQSLEVFQQGMQESEALLSEALDFEPVQKRLFSDYPGAIKSLGAWGGDFILAAGNENTPGYFNSRGYQTVLRYSEMALPES
ncbi:Mevalonate kinase [Robiginitalea myxolifaciens]|uniref:Mevalonate kinase n=1 Tax=Robiginitalea myxolifaciens TaxID=400055 RepID=A0A1I6GB18_9FLAO|nr:GYDIA family GHMP kinase [Robiginitalea myxolifaciens]SFR39267.1 Mevalonate kinase [Robiginitalea myxolifaciens]